MKWLICQWPATRTGRTTRRRTYSPTDSSWISKHNTARVLAAHEGGWLGGMEVGRREGWMAGWMGRGREGGREGRREGEREVRKRVSEEWRERGGESEWGSEGEREEEGGIERGRQRGTDGGTEWETRRGREGDCYNPAAFDRVSCLAARGGPRVTNWRVTGPPARSMCDGWTTLSKPDRERERGGREGCWEGEKDEEEGGGGRGREEEEGGVERGSDTWRSEWRMLFWSTLHSEIIDTLLRFLNN